jgi:comEA protein
MRHSVLFVLITAILVLPVVGIANDGPAPGTVNLNTANADQLQLLPRVGPALASRIISFRESNGPFRTVDELLAVKGIGETSLKHLSPYLSVSGDTTLAEKVSLPRSNKSNGEAS